MHTEEETHTQIYTDAGSIRSEGEQRGFLPGRGLCSLRACVCRKVKGVWVFFSGIKRAKHSGRQREPITTIEI